MPLGSQLGTTEGSTNLEPKKQYPSIARALANEQPGQEVRRARTKAKAKEKGASSPICAPPAASSPRRGGGGLGPMRCESGGSRLRACGWLGRVKAGTSAGVTVQVSPPLEKRHLGDVWCFFSCKPGRRSDEPSKEDYSGFRVGGTDLKMSFAWGFIKTTLGSVPSTLNPLYIRSLYSFLYVYLWLSRSHCHGMVISKFIVWSHYRNALGGKKNTPRSPTICYSLATSSTTPMNHHHSDQ